MGISQPVSITGCDSYFQRLFDSLRGVAIKCLPVTLGTFRSPITPLKKGGTVIKVSLFKGDLEGSKTFNTIKYPLSYFSSKNSLNL